MASCLHKQQPCTSLHRTQPQCLHGRSLLPRLANISQHSSRRTSLHSTGPATNDNNLDDIIDVLKDAFNTQTIPNRKALQQPSMHSSSVAPSFAKSTRRGSNGGSLMRHDGVSSNAAKPSPDKAGSRQTVEAAAPTVPAVPPKKRKGPFADLIASLEHDVQNPPADTSNSSTFTTSSSGSHEDASTALSPLSSSSGSTGNISSCTPAIDSSSPRKLTRRINRQNNEHTTQQQQHPALKQQPAQPKLQQPPPSMQQAAAAAAFHGKKQYKPVFKGDLPLPGGPSWSALRRHIVAAGTDPDLPTLSSIVIVEGDQDQRAVARAVNAPVYVCDGTRVLKEHVKPELSMLQQLGRPLIVLTDPDERGRELRVHLDTSLGPLLHAFVPEPDAAALADGPVHAAGNRGIEHVVPTGVQQALNAARMSYSTGRQVWSMGRLQELRLVNAFDDGATGTRGPGGAADRRRELCALLGLGRCNGGQLLSMLNRFFDEATVQAALAQLEPLQ